MHLVVHAKEHGRVESSAKHTGRLQFSKSQVLNEASLAPFTSVPILVEAFAEHYKFTGLPAGGHLEDREVVVEN